MKRLLSSVNAPSDSANNTVTTTRRRNVRIEEIDVDAPPLSSSEDEVEVEPLLTLPAQTEGTPQSELNRQYTKTTARRKASVEQTQSRARHAFSNPDEQLGTVKRPNARLGPRDENEGWDEAVWASNARSSGSQYGSQARSQRTSQNYGKKRPQDFHEPQNEVAESRRCTVIMTQSSCLMSYLQTLGKPKRQFKSVPDALLSSPSSKSGFARKVGCRADLSLEGGSLKSGFRQPPISSQNSNGSIRLSNKMFRMPECSNSDQALDDPSFNYTSNRISYISNSSGSPFSSPPASLILDRDFSGTSDDEQYCGDETRSICTCPLCGENITQSFYERVTTEKTGVRARLALCREHRVETALETSTLR